MTQNGETGHEDDRPGAADLRILSELQKDGSLSNVALAERIGMSPSPCLRRVKQLEAPVSSAATPRFWTDPGSASV
jgi:hypothetical protein